MKCAICNADCMLSQHDFPGFQKGTHFDIFSCRNCGCSFADPKTADTAQLYELIYRNAKRISGYRRYEKYRRTMKWKYFSNIESLASVEDCYWGLFQAIRSKEQSIGRARLKILEIGSGLGYTTHALRRSGYDVLGYDLSRVAVESATRDFGPHFTAVPFEHLTRDHRASFDVVFLTEVIEHIADPIAFLASLRVLLNSTGIIVLTTPNRLVFSENVVWAVTEPPVHFWWFSPKAVAVMAGRIGMQAQFVDFRPINRGLAPRTINGISLPGSVLDEAGNICCDYFDHRSNSHLLDYMKIIAKMILRRWRAQVPTATLLNLDECELFGMCLCSVLSLPCDAGLVDARSACGHKTQA